MTLPFDQITRDDIWERYALLPDAIFDVLDNPATEDVVAAVCEDHHLADHEKIALVKQLTTLALLGFIHDYDLGREISSALNLADPRAGNDIAAVLSQKIFTPIKTNLAQNYRPLAAGARETAASESPKIIDIGAPAQQLSRIPIPPPMPAAAMPKPVGIPTAPRPPAPTPPPSRPDGAKQAGEFAPVMLHEESSFAPAKATSGFKLDLPGAKTPSPLVSGPATLVPMAAKIDLGGRAVPPLAGGPSALGLRPISPATTTMPSPSANSPRPEWSGAHIPPPPATEARPAVASSFLKTQFSPLPVVPSVVPPPPASMAMPIGVGSSSKQLPMTPLSIVSEPRGVVVAPQPVPSHQPRVVNFTAPIPSAGGPPAAPLTPITSGPKPLSSMPGMSPANPTPMAPTPATTPPRDAGSATTPTNTAEAAKPPTPPKVVNYSAETPPPASN